MRTGDERVPLLLRQEARTTAPGRAASLLDGSEQDRNLGALQDEEGQKLPCDGLKSALTVEAPDPPRILQVDVIQAIQRRRKSAMVEILGRFEAEIEPLLPPGHPATENFKGVVRKRINGLAYEGIRAASAAPGESVSAVTVDLAADLVFDDTEDRIT